MGLFSPSKSHDDEDPNAVKKVSFRQRLVAVVGLAGFTLLIAASIVIAFAALTFVGLLLIEAVTG